MDGLIALALAKKASGGGMPDPSEYEDGTVLVKVGNEWKAQSGYGYTEESAFEKITWDGNTEGHEVLGESFCKVSDISMPSSALTGSKIKFYCNGEIMEFDFVGQYSMGTDIYAAVYGDGMQVTVALADTLVEEMEVHKGVYFMFAEGEGYSTYISELSFAPVVHKIDNTLFTSALYVENVYGILSVPFIDIYNAHKNGIPVFLYDAQKEIILHLILCFPDVARFSSVYSVDNGVAWVYQTDIASSGEVQSKDVYWTVTEA